MVNDNKDIASLLESRNLTPSELSALIDQIKNPTPRQEIYEHKWSNKHVRPALIGDNHIASKSQRIDYLKDFYNRCKKAKVDAVYNTGDITEGYGMRPGHSFECLAHGVDDQVKMVKEVYPDVGIPTYFICGNHDYSHYKSAGVDIGRIIEIERPDMHYLGFDDAKIEIMPNVILELSHPGKGSAYALSYHSQKLIESMSGGTKPKILAIGHYHKLEQLFYRNVHCFQTGTTQEQTPWMRRMNLSAHMGGWILDVYADKKGNIDKIISTLIPYYE